MKKGALVTYGTKDSSPEAPEEDYAEDRPFDLLEDRDLPPQRLALEQGTAAESSQAAERLTLTPAAAAAWVRPPQLEPDDDEEESPEFDAPNGMPPFSEYVPIQDWHPLRFVFDEDDRLIIPPGPVPAMYAFVTQAKKVIRQFNLEDVEVKGFVGPRPGAGQRPTLDIDALAGVYKSWDPRLQKLYAVAISGLLRVRMASLCVCVCRSLVP